MAEVRLVHLAPIELSEDLEAVGIGGDHLVDDSLESVAPESGQDHDHSDVGFLQHSDDIGDGHMLLKKVPGIIDVIVNVDGGEAGFGKMVDRDMESRDRLEIAQQESFLFRFLFRSRATSEAH